MESYDAYEYTKHLYSENLWLRSLLRTVAEDLELVAAMPAATDAPRLRARAMRIRRRLWEGYRGEDRGPHG